MYGSKEKIQIFLDLKIEYVPVSLHRPLHRKEIYIV